MALRVPTVDGPSVEARPLPGPYQRSSASPELLRGGTLSESAKALQQAASDIQEREDADVLMRAETEIKGKYLEWEGEAKQRKGQQAWGVAKEAGEFWDKESQRIGGTITSQRAKQLFQREVMKGRALAVGSFSGFEAGQRRASLDESAQASIVGSINLAAANPNNGEVLNATKGDIIRRMDLRAKLNGWDDAIKDAKQSEALTNFHKQVIQGLVRDNPDAAAAYFEKNKGEIEGSQHAEVGAFAAKATATRQGEVAADAAWQKLGPKGDRDPVQLDVLEESIRKSSLGDEAKKTAIANLKERAIAFKDSRRERDDQLEASVNMAVMKGAGMAQISRMPEFMRMDGEKQRKLMDFMENRALRAEQHAAAREGRLAAAESREQTRLARQGMGAYLIYSNPDTLAGMSENQVINLLPTLGNELTSHLMQQKRQLAAHPGKLAEAKMDQDDFNHIGRQMGLTVDEKATPEQKETLGELKFRVEQRIEAVQQATKKTLARDEKMQLMREEMARTVTVNPGMFSRNKEVPVIALSRDQAQRVVIPPADRTQISNAMQRMYQKTGSAEYAPTEDNLRRFYLLNKSPAADMILPPKK